jgi:cold shock CspA family protein
MVGTVIRVFLDKGYGFIRGADGLSRFLHASDLQEGENWDLIELNTHIEFDPSKSDKGNGLKAINVRLLNT